jgi:hypothetical protein
MGKTLSLDDFRQHLEDARERLAQEKTIILHLHPFTNPLPGTFSREEYAFSYLRAERLGVKTIQRSLASIAWLPLQLDPQEEIDAKGRAVITRWTRDTRPTSTPDGSMFGNDFIHVLTRGGLLCGWDSAEFTATMTRIARLYHDLSCLVGLVFYGTWLAQNRIQTFRLSNTDDLERMAVEVFALIRAQAGPALGGTAPKAKAGAGKKKGSEPLQGFPVKQHLHVISNDDGDPELPFI